MSVWSGITGIDFPGLANGELKLGIGELLLGNVFRKCMKVIDSGVYMVCSQKHSK